MLRVWLTWVLLVHRSSSRVCASAPPSSSFLLLPIWEQPPQAPGCNCDGAGCVACHSLKWLPPIKGTAGAVVLEASTGQGRPHHPQGRRRPPR
jgi:hypothetical protein